MLPSLEKNEGAAEDPRERKPSPFIIGAAAVILMTAVVLRVHQAAEERKPVLARVEIGGAVFLAEVADTPEKQELGLGGREALGEEEAMYFPFPAAGRLVFWMKGMRFPIDIVWIRNGTVIDVSRSLPVPGMGPLRTFSPSEPADAVLEINAGLAEQHGIEKGDAVSVKLDSGRRSP
jgi:hypothetical protein